MNAGFKRALSLALGVGMLSMPVSAASTFTDVPSTYWGYSYITEAASKGLVSGLGDGTYGPDNHLSNAHFITMVSNLFYSSAVANQGNSGDWWLPYLNVAYSAGLLRGTTAESSYLNHGGWTAEIADAEISRYDMAQILANVSTAQGWESPEPLALLLAQATIQDWESIPAAYQNAVAVSYAKGFLSGDENGYFNGSNVTTRAQAAVVLCSLNEANTNFTSPVYTNTNRLTNGLSDTEENVSDLLDDLRTSYPEYDVWNMERSYTSQRLGSGTGDRALVYMLSDRIFGAMPAVRLDDPADLRVGDVIAFGSGPYGLVASVNSTEDSFTYVTCDSGGWITWRNTEFLEDLSHSDTVYTRYLELPAADDELTNGDKATESNVRSLMSDILNSRYGSYYDDEVWDMDYEYDDSEIFRSASGDRGFAYFLSDQIFGDLSDYDVDWPEDLRAGDVIYDNYYERYGVVRDIEEDNETCRYYSVNSDGEVQTYTGYFSDIDSMITRYPEETDRRDEEDELTNGDPITTRNVAALLDDVLNEIDDDYGSYWDMEDEFDFHSFDEENVTGSEAFAYYVSDEIFGTRTVDAVDHAEDLRVGDVMYDDEENRYGIVMEMDGDLCVYASVDNEDDGYIDWYFECSLDDIRESRMYTRY